jgi:SAM-dependent methyltransferase
MLHVGGGPGAMSDEVLSFYEVLADHYHLIFEDWDRSIQRQADLLSSVISQQLPGPLTILDCACGIGTQSIGLATLGYRLLGCDLSPAEVARATREARQRGLDVEFRVSDMTKLEEIPETGFDVVSAFDNALPHLTSEELIRAAGAMAAKLRPGGLFLASIRDTTHSCRKNQLSSRPRSLETQRTEELSIRSGTGRKMKRTSCTFTFQLKLTKVGVRTISSRNTGLSHGKSCRMRFARLDFASRFG